MSAQDPNGDFVILGTDDLLPKLLLKTADVLFQRYGEKMDHDLETIKAIGLEVIKRYVMEPDQVLIDKLNERIEHVFSSL